MLRRGTIPAMSSTNPRPPDLRGTLRGHAARLRYRQDATVGALSPVLHCHVKHRGMTAISLVPTPTPEH